VFEVARQTSQQRVVAPVVSEVSNGNRPDWR